VLAVPNFSEGRDAGRVERIAAAFASSGSAVLDTHSDATHNRTVLTLEGAPGDLSDALAAGAVACAGEIDMTAHEGAHPCIGALDVCPLVWLAEAERAGAEEAARALGARIAAEVGVPVFLYGALASEPRRRERAYFREGGLAELHRRMAAGELAPDFGPAEPHPTAGATLVSARTPLAAFNVELDSADVEVARAVAAGLRESGGGLPGVRALGLALDGGRTQVSTNVHDPAAVPLAAVVERVRELAAEHGARPVEAELIGLAPEAALAGYPGDVPLRGLDPARHVIERRLGRA
jgi:glutamate formiminotransferase